MWVGLMKRDIKASEIIIRLLLLFMWPIGIIPLVISKRIKHKVCLAFIYFALFCFVGFPMLMYILLPFGAISDGYDFSYGTIVASNMSTMWFELLAASKVIWVTILMFIVSLVMYICKIRQDKAIAERELITVDNQNKVNESIYQAQDTQNLISYQKAQVLTEREKNFYETIRPIAEKLDLNVSSKVRLADIVNVSDEIQKQSNIWWSKFEKISQKHIDFALQDKSNLEIKLLIEIDDYTHQRADRIERDEFVDSVCKQANIPILHLYDVIGLEDKIINILHSEKTEQEM